MYVSEPDDNRKTRAKSLQYLRPDLLGSKVEGKICQDIFLISARADTGTQNGNSQTTSIWNAEFPSVKFGQGLLFQERKNDLDGKDQENGGNIGWKRKKTKQ